MERTLTKYTSRIERDQINCPIRFDGKTSGLLLDPAREEIPLEVGESEHEVVY